MTLGAFRHATDALDHLAILVVMALATLEVCFMNPAVMRRSVKIRKGQTVWIEAWAEHHYPSFITIAHSSATNSTSVEMPTTDARMRIVKRDQLRDSHLKAEAEAKRCRELRPDERKGGMEQEGLPWALIAVVAALFLGICVIAGAIVYLAI
ncbi:bifunctional farnesyl-diphosphate farnesyltransferase/squalene synthase [Ceratobasidium sp. 395]|nr:bifunctional farnesyl-diphosphate farnesyltransferase/squalene synthase [Ceratobasidium sp. 395]